MNISSIVVRTRPDFLKEVKRALLESGLCEIHFSDEEGRIVAVIEGDSDEDESKKLRKIAALPRVASAEFAYTYADPGKDSDGPDIAALSRA